MWPFKKKEESGPVEVGFQGQDVQAHPTDSERKKRYAGRIQRLQKKLNSVPKNSEKYKQCEQSLKKYRMKLEVLGME